MLLLKLLKDVNLMREKFSGYTVGVGVILYMFFTYGFANVISVAMGVLPQYYNVDISSVVLTCSASSIAAFATSAFVHRFIKKFTPRGTLVVGAFCWLAYCWFIGFSNNIIFMYMAQIVSGFALGCCMHASCSIIIMNWFIEKRGRMISLCMSAGTFGGSLMIYISGVLLPILGVSRFFIYSGIVLCAVCLFCAIVLVKNDPAAVGQKALGWEKAQNIQHDGDIKNNTASSPISSQKNLFSSKKFWMFAIGVVFAMSSISYIGLYTTTVLPMHGIDFSKASALFSILTL